MASLTIDLPPELDQLVRERIASGLYSDASEVVRDALERLEREDTNELAAVRAALEPSIADLDAGRVVDKTILDVIAARR